MTKKQIFMHGQAQVDTIGQNAVAIDKGVDKDGKSYTVTFLILEDFDVNSEPDLSEAANWDAPLYIEDDERNQYLPVEQVVKGIELVYGQEVPAVIKEIKEQGKDLEQIAKDLIGIDVTKEDFEKEIIKAYEDYQFQGVSEISVRGSLRPENGKMYTDYLTSANEIDAPVIYLTVEDGKVIDTTIYR